MRKLNRIGSMLPIIVALFLNSAQTQTPDPLQVLKAETAHSERTWRRGIFARVTTIYEEFDLKSCTLSFKTKTLQKGKSDIIDDPPQIYRYAFPLQNMDVRLEWLDAYNSYVVSLSGSDSVLTIEASTPSLVFVTNVEGNKLQAPNISIPFENEESAKRFQTALLGAVAACGSKGDLVQRINAPSGHNDKDLTQDVNNEKYAVKVNVDLVTTDVTVIGDNVPELRTEDFVIYDNRVSQQISYFSHDLPISVALVLEPQTAVIGTSEMHIAALSALRLLKPGDQVALYSLNGDRLSNLTEDRLHIAKLVRFLANDQRYDWNIFGTLYDAAHYLKEEASGRRAIMLISHNIHAGNTLGVSDYGHFGRKPLSKSESNNVVDRCRLELLESAITLYNITPDNSAMRLQNLYDPQIKSIAEDTGGEMIVVADEDKRSVIPQNGLNQAIKRLRTQYTLGFTPSNPGEQGSFHELTVQLANKDRCPNCKIKSRRGYYAGVAAPLPPAKKPQPKPLQSPSEIDNKIVQESMVMAGLSYFDLDDISFAITNAEKMKSPNGQSQMMIDLSINPAGIDTIIAEGRRTYRMQAAIFYSDKKGNILGSNYWIIEGSLSEEDYNRIKEKGIPFSALIPIKADDQILKIVIYDEIGGRMASKFTKKKGKSLTVDKRPMNLLKQIVPKQILETPPDRPISTREVQK